MLGCHRPHDISAPGGAPLAGLVLRQAGGAARRRRADWCRLGSLGKRVLGHALVVEFEEAGIRNIPCSSRPASTQPAHPRTSRSSSTLITPVDCIHDSDPSTR